MNALALIQTRLQRQQKVEKYNRSIAYRGVTYSPEEVVSNRTGETCYTYRGRTYCKNTIKWFQNKTGVTDYQMLWITFCKGVIIAVILL